MGGARYGPPRQRLDILAMRVSVRDFDAASFSLREHPVLVIEDFWTTSEMAQFRRAMAASQWVAREQMPDTSESFAGCGNWKKAEIVDPEQGALVDRILMPFVISFIDSIAGVVGRVMSFNYFDYGSGDCLTLHSDERTDRRDDERRESVTRRIALATYVHETWDVNWGGELITYEVRNGGYEVDHCIAPDPGSLVLFTVPRHHRVCRVDPLAGSNRRLSIAGWFMTDHGTD